jgi:hypothetical protein
MIARNFVGKKWRRAITSKLNITMDIARSNVHILQKRHNSVPVDENRFMLKGKSIGPYDRS